ncbi:Aste57867_24568 [Aphanomyces stellatus]|uniref:Aste57867_24568 protein n=1 Tax=Aphanomyces stellatus TaxID=120398 RepID=A0A485LRT7_9STRA|nr:hypothetical protein As57867_024490 [Aphanomyces stellatus]VFU01207.1 Aste57867_24568 [Aphanomyces stellatus]
MTTSALPIYVSFASSVDMERTLGPAEFFAEFAEAGENPAAQLAFLRLLATDTAHASAFASHMASAVILRRWVDAAMATMNTHLLVALLGTLPRVPFPLASIAAAGLNAPVLALRKAAVPQELQDAAQQLLRHWRRAFKDVATKSVQTRKTMTTKIKSLPPIVSFGAKLSCEQTTMCERTAAKTRRIMWADEHGYLLERVHLIETCDEMKQSYAQAKLDRARKRTHDQMTRTDNQLEDDNNDASPKRHCLTSLSPLRPLYASPLVPSPVCSTPTAPPLMGSTPQWNLPFAPFGHEARRFASPRRYKSSCAFYAPTATSSDGGLSMQHAATAKPFKVIRCRHFNTPAGCKKGNKCTYIHESHRGDLRPWQLRRIHRRPNYLPTQRSNPVRGSQQVRA